MAGYVVKVKSGMQNYNYMFYLQMFNVTNAFCLKEHYISEEEVNYFGKMQNVG